MRLSNFRNKRKIKDYVYADVDVTIGTFFKRKTTHIIYRLSHCSFWRFLDSGEHTPYNDAEALESGYDAQLVLKETDIE